MRILTAKDAKAIKYPVVYGIFNGDTGEMVYVGQTVNISKRLEAYKFAPHSEVLRSWLASHRWHMEILEHNPPDLTAAEVAWIKKHKATLLNLFYGDSSVWLSRERKPWMGGRGIKCPSDIMLAFLRNRKSKHYKELFCFLAGARKSMSDKDRIAYEIGIASDFISWGVGPSIERWLSQTSDRMEEALRA